MIALLLTTAAWAWESEPVPLAFADDNPVFVTFAYDTGYLPSQSDPISVRFSITPTGGVSTSFDAVSQLTWPPVLTHEVVGTPGTGTLEVDAEGFVRSQAVLSYPRRAARGPYDEQAVLDVVLSETTLLHQTDQVGYPGGASSPSQRRSTRRRLAAPLMKICYDDFG